MSRACNCLKPRLRSTLSARENYSRCASDGPLSQSGVNAEIVARGADEPTIARPMCTPKAVHDWKTAHRDRRIICNRSSDIRTVA
jgi:hypothetical protein